MRITKSVVLFFILLLSPVYILLAEKVEIKTAKLLATNFYFEKGRLSGSDLKDPVTLSHTYTQFVAKEEIYYVFSSENGYIIVAADDNAYPVLAYSFEGGYSAKNMSPEFTYWMSTYENQIVNIRKNKTKADQKISDAWNYYTTGFDQALNQKGTTKSMEPLLMSNWDQGTYYNFLCPEDPAGPGGHVWSGCVATAMAQVMYYYRYPLQGSGSHGYNSNYGYLFADFGSTNYDWYEMQHNISGKFNYQMALIQLHCGIAIDMDYSPDGSGAFMFDDADAMKNNFGYSSSTELFYKSDYSYADWANLLISNLDNKMPIQYAGFGNGAGHAFVCDGYQGTDFFHFNWGWSGAYNGYFYLDNLNPGYTFSNGQQAILNCYPAAGFPQNCSGTKTITNYFGTIEDGSSPKYNYQNNNDCRWLIAPTDPIDNIKITFNRLNTENGNDIIRIYDGETTADPILGVFSGNTLPADITSTGNKVLVRFSTNGTNVADGWLLTFNGKKTKFCNSMAELTTPSGIISDGSGTFDYNSSTICHWLIKPADAGSITITFNDFDLASDEDFVKIYDNSTSTEIITLQSGALPQTFTAYTGDVGILFFTNTQNNAGGWELSYTSEPLSIQENSDDYVSILPNPATDYLKIQASVVETASLNITIFSNTGSLVCTKNVSLSNNLLDETIDISGFSKGLYFLKLSSDKFNHTQKFVIR